ncbi:UNVERIFIED_CONTAM: hypothetical protein FKN15_068710 [Acipenser sinensis]
MAALEAEEVGTATAALEATEVGTARTVPEAEDVEAAMAVPDAGEVGTAMAALEAEEVGTATAALEATEVGTARTVPEAEDVEAATAVPRLERSGKQRLPESLQIRRQQGLYLRLERTSDGEHKDAVVLLKPIYALHIIMCLMESFVYKPPSYNASAVHFNLHLGSHHLNFQISDNRGQGCIVLENAEVAVLRAPKESSSMKSSKKGVGQSIHTFSFSQVLV